VCLSLPVAIQGCSRPLAWSSKFIWCPAINVFNKIWLYKCMCCGFSWWISHFTFSRWHTLNSNQHQDRKLALCFPRMSGSMSSVLSTFLTEVLYSFSSVPTKNERVASRLSQDPFLPNLFQPTIHELLTKCSVRCLQVTHKENTLKVYPLRDSSDVCVWSAINTS